MATAPRGSPRSAPCWTRHGVPHRPAASGSDEPVPITEYRECPRAAALASCWSKHGAAHDKFNALLADQVTPWFKRRGFKRRNGTYRRRSEEAWQIVNFQRDNRVGAEVVRFTINVGVSLDVLNEAPSWRQELRQQLQRFRERPASPATALRRQYVPQQPGHQGLPRRSDRTSHRQRPNTTGCGDHRRRPPRRPVPRCRHGDLQQQRQRRHPLRPDPRRRLDPRPGRTARCRWAEVPLPQRRGLAPAGPDRGLRWTAHVARRGGGRRRQRRRPGPNDPRRQHAPSRAHEPPLGSRRRLATDEQVRRGVDESGPDARPHRRSRMGSVPSPEQAGRQEGMPSRKRIWHALFEPCSCKARSRKVGPDGTEKLSPRWTPSSWRDARPSDRGADLQGLLRVSDGTRTRGRRDHNPELYQLSYAHRVGLSIAALRRWCGALRGGVKCSRSDRCASKRVRAWGQAMTAVLYAPGAPSRPFGGWAAALVGRKSVACSR